MHCCCVYNSMLSTIGGRKYIFRGYSVRDATGEEQLFYLIFKLLYGDNLIMITGNQENRECPHTNDKNAELTYRPLFISWFILNCLRLSAWLTEWLSHCMPHNNKLKQMCVNATDSKLNRDRGRWGFHHLWFMISYLGFAGWLFFITKKMYVLSARQCKYLFK